MSEVPESCLYTKDHEWLRLEDDGSVTVGITDHAQEALGELVFVELPEAGAGLGVGDACAVIESVKAASDIYCPVAGEVTEANASLTEEPELVNSSPYGDGWVFRLRPEDAKALDQMMDAESYGRFLAEVEA
ncbi:MAG: glycine cleavage system protein GcvH [Gammaproteobacteria bacterium]|jgi:glycine cleavage system H protein|nr:glycine cleavage system protein GcvH [Gammaproteobacteria bacterium]MDP7270762.1 glycine cleavage system protein GcvH [Gammaproteobacteria bacterium]